MSARSGRQHFDQSGLPDYLADRDMNKMVIVVLILIVAVFFIFVGWGSFASESEEDPQNVKAPPGSESFSNLFGFLQEKVVLDCAQKPLSNAKIQCEKLSLGNTNIPPAKEPFLPFLKKTTFRTAKLILRSGQASIVYADKKGGGKIKNPQTFFLPNPQNNNAAVESIIILEKGGTLNISCKGAGSCQVGQQ